jgi:hypothetical protein
MLAQDWELDLRLATMWQRRPLIHPEQISGDVAT